MSICEELEELIPAYVLDAVEESDRARIESHLALCPRCAQLIETYRPVADSLAYAVQAEMPRAELRYKVLAAMPKTSPPVQAAASKGTLSDWLRSLWRAPTFSTLSPALAALALILVVGLGAWNVILQNQIAQQAATTNQLAADLSRTRNFLTALAYADEQPWHLQGTATASKAIGRLYAVYDETSFIMVTYDLPTLKPDQTYQLWLIDSAGNRTSGGVFAVDDRGRGWLFGRSSKPLKEYQSVGVTVEPLGGSPGPTGAKMLGGDL